MGKKVKVLFICLDNICRSPIAEAAFTQAVNEAGEKDKWKIDSAALRTWHVGNPPDERASQVLEKNKVKYSHTVRQITRDDFSNFDFIFAMDHQNIGGALKIAPENSKAEIQLFGAFDPDSELVIQDPSYDENDKGFQKCYEHCVRCSKGFLEAAVRMKNYNN